MKWEINRLVVFSFGLAIAILLIIGYFFFQSIENSQQAANSRRLGFRTQLLLEQYLSTLKDAETGQRGYLLSGEDKYLKPYQDAVHQIAIKSRQIQENLSENPKKNGDFREIQSLTQEKLGELSETITLRRNGHRKEAVDIVRSDEGKRLMDMIRQKIGAMIAVEDRVITVTDDRLTQGFQNTLLFSAVGFLLAFALLLFGTFQLNSQIAARQRSNQQLQEEVVERSRAEGEVIRLNDNLERQLVAVNAANKELEAFAYSVSHDLRAPLRSIDGFSKILEEKAHDKLDEQENRYLGIISENAQRMGELIDDLLNLSRLTRSEMRLETIDLSGMVLTILKSHQADEPERKVTFHVEPGLQVTGDPNLVRVMMENLLNNAWKYTSKREEALIEFGSKEENGKTVYFVKDNGAGFNMKYADKLFGVFQRLHRMDEFPGTGIGLATVQRIIRRHGGAIWANAEVEKGAVFYFTL